MGLFNFKKKKQEEQEEAAPQRQTNPGTFMIIRLLAVGYLLWTIKSMVDLYIAGGEDAPSLAMLLFTCVLFGAGCVWIAWISYKQYKRMKEEQAAYEDDEDELDPEDEEDEEDLYLEAGDQSAEDYEEEETDESPDKE